MNIPSQPTEISPQQRIHFGAIGGFKALPHHHWYAWDEAYGYTLCGEAIAKQRPDDIGTDQLTLSISNGPDCAACRQRMNELLAAYDDARRD